VSCSAKHKGPPRRGSEKRREMEERGEFVPRTARETMLGHRVETPSETELRELKERVTVAEQRADAAEARLTSIERGRPGG